MDEKLCTTHIFTFRNKINKTFYKNGLQTIPVEYNRVMQDCCHLNESVNATIVLPDGFEARGRLYHGINNSTEYYQFAIDGGPNLLRLERQIPQRGVLEFRVDPTQRRVCISPVS